MKVTAHRGAEKFKVEGEQSQTSIDLVPVLLGRGVRFFEYMGIEPVELETASVIAAPGGTHLSFRVLK
jgi:hypothetical protein